MTAVRLRAHLPDEPALLRILHPENNYTLGRAPDCDLVLDHTSVSRQHARLAVEDGAWQLIDLGSKNGVRISGNRVHAGVVQSGQWFSLGDVLCQFDAIDADQIAAAEKSAEHRRQNSRAWVERIQQAEGLESVLEGLLRAIVELAECQRGFVLGGNARTGLRVLACYRMSPGELASNNFRHSTGAVDRALQQRRPVFLGNAKDNDFLKHRASVFALDLRVLTCLPLIHDGHLLGAVYADSDEDGKSFSELDAEILSAFADQAAVALVAADLDEAVAKFDACLRVAEAGNSTSNGPAPSWDMLRAAPPR